MFLHQQQSNGSSGPGGERHLNPMMSLRSRPATSLRLTRLLFSSRTTRTYILLSGECSRGNTAAGWMHFRFHSQREEEEQMMRALVLMEEQKLQLLEFSIYRRSGGKWRSTSFIKKTETDNKNFRSVPDFGCQKGHQGLMTPDIWSRCTASVNNNINISLRG